MAAARQALAPCCERRPIRVDLHDEGALARRATVALAAGMLHVELDTPGRHRLLHLVLWMEGRFSDGSLTAQLACCRGDIP